MQLILAAHPEKLKMSAVKSQFTIKHLTEPYQHGNHWEPRNMVVEPYKCHINIGDLTTNMVL
jgi:hypothetical protein